MSVSANSDPPATLEGLEVPDRFRHTPHEALIGVPFGRDRTASRLPRRSIGTPREALGAAVLAALRRPPCLVTFSGGRDSSTILALAVDLARRHGLPEPIPITNRFPDSPASDEAKWQEMVIAHLAPSEWVRLEWTDELDMLGPYAQRVLRRHGALFPSNAHFLEPFLERAAGGSLLTGLGGDELLGPSPRPVAGALLFARRLPRRGQLRQAAKELAPLPLRARLEAARSPVHLFGWIRPGPRDAVAIEFARSAASIPIAWDRSLEGFWQKRYLRCLDATTRALGAAHDVKVGSPFLDPNVLRAYADSQGHRPAPPRAEMLLRLVGTLLPPELLRRRTKASFDEPYWNRHTRAFTEQWTGNGVDSELVDPDRLAEEWRSTRPIAASSTLLQQAWLASSAGDVSG